MNKNNKNYKKMIFHRCWRTLSQNFWIEYNFALSFSQYHCNNLEFKIIKIIFDFIIVNDVPTSKILKQWF